MGITPPVDRHTTMFTTLPRGMCWPLLMALVCFCAAGVNGGAVGRTRAGFAGCGGGIAAGEMAETLMVLF
jgi:hypothetical protein